MAFLVGVLVLLCTALAGCQDLPYTYPPLAEARPNTTSIYFGLLQSFGGTYNSSGSIPGVEVALDRINSDANLLPGYTLHYVLRDSFVSAVASEVAHEVGGCQHACDAGPWRD